MGYTREDRRILRRLTKTTYDQWLLPVPLDTMILLFKKQPRNFTTVSIQEVEDFVLACLKKEEPLIEQFSQEMLSEITSAIRYCYYLKNVVDTETGGDGLTVPTFMELISSLIFSIRDKEFKSLKSESDHKFYHKYFWCFEQMALTKYQYQKKTA